MDLKISKLFLFYFTIIFALLYLSICDVKKFKFSVSINRKEAHSKKFDFSSPIHKKFSHKEFSHSKAVYLTNGNSSNSFNDFQVEEEEENDVHSKKTFHLDIGGNNAPVLLDFSSSIHNTNETSERLMTIEIYVGSPPQKFDLMIDTGSTVLWMVDKDNKNGYKLNHVFDKKSSSTYKTNDAYVELNYGSGHAYGYVSKDLLTIYDSEEVGRLNSSFVGGESKKSSIDINFILAEDIAFNSEADGILGLSYNDNTYDKEFHLIEQLYAKQIIEKRIFSVKYISEKRGEFDLGDYPPEVKEYAKKEAKKSGKSNEDYSFLGKCNLLDNFSIGTHSISNPYWSCKLKGFFTGFKRNVLVATTTQQVIFDTGSNFNYVSKSFWKGMIKYYFKNLIDQGACEEGFLDHSQSTIGLVCTDYNAIKKQGAFNMIFDDHSFFMWPEEMFFYNNGYYISNFLLMGSGQIFILGEPFLKLFTTIYNYEDKLFQVYGENVYSLSGEYRPKERVIEDNITIGYLMYAGFGGLVFSLLIVMFILVRKYLNSKKQYNNLNEINQINDANENKENKSFDSINFNNSEVIIN